MTEILQLPRMLPMKSSNIEAIGYDEGHKELHVRFKGGGHYVYEGVPIELHHQFLADESPGAFLAKNLKGQFKHRKH